MNRISVEKIDTFGGHRDCLYALELGLQPGTFISSGADGLVVGWDLQAPDQGKLQARVGGTVYAMCLLPERQQLVVAENGQGLHLIDLQAQQEVASLQVGGGSFFALLQHDGLLYLAAADGSVSQLGLEPLRLLRSVRLSEKSARSLCVDAARSRLWIGYSDGHIRVLDLQTLRLLADWEAHGMSVFSLALSPDGRQVLSGGRDAHLRAWDAEGFGPLQDVVAHMYTINDISYSPDARYFATCSKDKSVKVWDAATLRLRKVIDRARHAGHGTSVNKVRWLSNQLLVSCSDDRTLSVWKIGEEEGC